jgi:hypothetical protein
MKYGATKGKAVFGSDMTSEKDIEQIMGADWLRDHPVPWKVPAKK